MQRLQKSEGHELDIPALLPFLSKSHKNLGRTVGMVIHKVLEEYLNAEKESYTALPGGKYLLHLHGNKNLGIFKRDVISKEICRRICKAIQEKYASLSTSAALDRAADMGLEKSKVPAPRRCGAQKRNLPMQEDRLPPEEGEIIDYDTLARQTEVVFRPVWNVPKRYVTGFIARHADESLNAENGGGRHRHAPAGVRAKADLGLLARSTTELVKMLDENQKMVLVIPVFFDTLVRHPYRERYLEFFGRVPPEARSLVVLQIKKIPVYSPKERIQEIQKDIAGLTRSLVITSDLRDQNFDCLLKENVHAGAVFLTKNPSQEFYNISLMEQFAEKMHAVNRAAMADGIASKSMMCAAISAGFNYVSGPAVQPDQPSLGSIRPLELHTLYTS